MTNSCRFLPLYLLFLLVPFSGCDVLGGDDDQDKPGVSGVIVANGGNYSDQNGTLTYHDPQTRTTTHSASLAGFVQGLVHGDAAGQDAVLALVNTFGPGRIDVLHSKMMSVMAQYTDMDSPRDAIFANDLLWVSTFSYGQPGTLLALDESGTVHHSVGVGDVPEGVAHWNDLIIVANNGNLGAGTTLSAVPVTGGPATSIETGCDGPRDVVAAGSLVVVCTGKTVYSPDFSEIIEQIPGQVIFMDDDLAVVSRIVLSSQARSTNGTKAVFHSLSTNELFLTLSSEERIVVVDLAERTIDQVLDLSGHATLIGLSGIAYDAGRDHLYAGRFPQSAAGAFPDYAAAGTVQVLSRGGEELAAFKAGAAISAIIIQ